MCAWSEVPLNKGSHRFHTTRWSLVAAAAGPDSGGRRALQELCVQYWPPIYAFARQRGYPAEQAQDLTQGFFLDLLERRVIDSADQRRGRFRTFLVTCFSNFLANQHDAEAALKRGGGKRLIELDAADMERQHGVWASSAPAPEAAYERSWALTVIARVKARLREEYADRRRQEICAALEIHLEGSRPGLTYKRSAAELGISEGAVKVTVHRMRHRFGELLLEEVSQTLVEGADPVEEIQYLLRALGGEA